MLIKNNLKRGKKNSRSQTNNLCALAYHESNTYNNIYIYT